LITLTLKFSFKRHVKLIAADDENKPAFRTGPDWRVKRKLGSTLAPASIKRSIKSNNGWKNVVTLLGQ
jgi:hypothetical protein